MKEKQQATTVRCDYCAGQGIQKLAFLLSGKEAETQRGGYVRYGCSNGHKFAVRKEGA